MLSLESCKRLFDDLTEKSVERLMMSDADIETTDLAMRYRARRDKRTPRDRQLRSKYGLSADDVEEMIATQGGRCKICRSLLGATKTDRPNVDHNHETGAVRGILCHPCNVGIGCFHDDPKRLVAAMGYLIENGH